MPAEGQLWPSAYNDDEMLGMIHDDSECDGWVETSLNLPVSEFSRGSFAHCDAMGDPRPSPTITLTMRRRMIQEDRNPLKEFMP